MAKIIAFLNQKGGVGKTTLTLNIGAGLALKKKKVLLVDLDSQANLTCSLGFDLSKIPYDVYDLLCDSSLTKKAILDVGGGLSLISSSMALSGFEQKFNNFPKREFLLKNILRKIQGYDYILIDCPPSLGLLTVNALAAADKVVIPMLPEYLALQGLSQLLNTYKIIKQKINKKLEIGGIIATRYNRRKINKEIVSLLGEQFNDKLFKTLIRENISLAEAPSFGKDIYTYAPHSIGAKDYKALCKEFMSKGL